MRLKRQRSQQFPNMTMADGYAIQSAWLDIKRAEGRKVIGYKIGLTSRAMQINSQIDEPDYGSLLDDMLFADGSEIPLDRFVKPLIEVELAFMLNRPLKGPGGCGGSALDRLHAVSQRPDRRDRPCSRCTAASGQWHCLARQ